MSRTRIWLEIAAVMGLSLLGLTVGGLLGWLPLVPIAGMLLPIAGASYFLYRDGSTWRDLGFARRMPLGRFVGYTLATLVLVFVATNYVATPIARSLGAPPLDVELLRQAIEGNLINYLLFLIPITWGSAAFGEELIARGFLQDRFSKLGGRHAAVLLQAIVFAAGHFYQGLMGVANIFALAVVFGYVYYACGRNLWPLIVAHGLIDTLGMTALYLGRSDLVGG